MPDRAIIPLNWPAPMMPTHMNQPVDGSGFDRTSAVCRSRNARSASINGGCLPASIAAASNAAFFAPGSPMATVATGTPAGICTIDSSESRPLSACDWIGTPITGSKVLEGKIQKGNKLKLTRNGVEIGLAHVVSIRKQKEEVTIVGQGEECGILFEPQLDFKVNDVLLSVSK